MEWFLKRLSEPSTWAGLGQVVATVMVPGVPVVAQVAMGIMGAVSVFAPEAARK